jgi:outer membrane receptor protein involved in Fe transport
MMTRIRARAAASGLVLGAALLGGAEVAFAQSSPPPAPPSQPPSVTVDGIVVTAQKRTQSLQDVPIVVTAVSKQLIQDAGVKDIKDLTILVPGLTVTSTTSEASTSARIRGIGTVGDNVGLESSVGVVIDGVYRPRNGVGFGDLGDVDRIEVLKGPQGTLFGKSTSAGVINVITAAPTFNFHSNAEFTAGDYGAVGGSAEVSGPLFGDKVAASLYIADRHRDGFYTVDTGYGPRTSTQDNTQNFYALRAQVLFEPDSNLKVRVIADYTHRDEQCCAAVVYRDGVAAGLDAALAGGGGGEAQTPNPFTYKAQLNRPDPNDVIDEGVSAQVDYKMPSLNASLTSITAYRDWRSLTGSDADYSNADLFYRPGTDANSDRFQDFSQEVRFAGVADKLDYLVGGFYANEELHSNFSLLYGTQFTNYLSLLFSSSAGAPNINFLPANFGANYAPNQGAVDRYRQNDNTYAVFTNDTYHITPKLDVNLGLRYTIDNKVLNSDSTNTNDGAGCAAVNGAYNFLGDPAALAVVNSVSCLPFESPAYNDFTDRQSETEHEVSGSAKLSYRFNPLVLTYASYARGFKAGGFNLDRVACPTDGLCANPGALTPDLNTSFPGEFADSYELGVKSTLLHRTLILNATVFSQRFTNFQLNTFTGLVFVVTPVPVVNSNGVDADFVWLPTRNLSFQGGLTVADTRFTKGDQAALLAGNPQYLGAPGARLPLAPLYSASIAATYSHDLGRDYMGAINFDAKYSSQYNTGSDEDPGKEQPSYWLADARLVLGPKSKAWDVEVWSQNVFNQRYIQVAFDSGFQNAPTNGTGVLDAFLGNPRTFGVTLRARY